jgi:hypothetical protein
MNLVRGIDRVLDVPLGWLLRDYAASMPSTSWARTSSAPLPES